MGCGRGRLGLEEGVWRYFWDLWGTGGKGGEVGRVCFGGMDIDGEEDEGYRRVWNLLKDVLEGSLIRDPPVVTVEEAVEAIESKVTLEEVTPSDVADAFWYVLFKVTI